MRRRIILSSFFIVSVLIISAAGTFALSRQTNIRTVETNTAASSFPSKTDIATRLSYGYFDEWYDEMIAWAAELPQYYTDQGDPIAFDASLFFNMKYLELLARDDLEEIEQNDLPEESTRKWDGYTKTNTGTHCDIYVETGSNSFASLMNEFDNKIWPSNQEAFGTVGFKIDVYVYYRDGSSPDSDGGGGVGGFFTGSRPHRVYVDSADISGWGYEILAHEYQHLLHHNKDANENLWINEGCADWAIIKAYGQNAGGVRNHLDYFESYPDNDLTQFDNYPYDYGSTAAWISYLADQYGGDAFTKALIADSRNGFSGVSSAISSQGHSDTALDAYLNWLVANYLDNTDIGEGKYGYSNLNIKVKLEETYSSLPISDSSSVKSWGADYYKFRNGQEGFGVEFQGKGGGNDFGVWVIKMGSTNVEVEYMDLDANDYGKHPLQGFGSTYSSVIIIVTADEDANYDFGIIHMDTLPPVTAISVNPVVPDGTNGYYVTQPEISLSTEPLATTYYYWNNGENETNIYTSSLKVPEGINNLNFYSVDEYTNQELTRTYNYKVDTIVPQTELVLLPEKPDGPLFNGWYITHPNIEFIGETEAKIYYRWDDGDEKRYEGNIRTFEGEHDLHYWSVDEAGNIEESEEITLLIDTMAPITVADMTIDDAPVESSEWYNKTVRIELVTELEVQTMYSWDGESFNLYDRVLESPEGEHVLSFYSIDEAGNQEYLKDVLVRTDTISPRTTISLLPEEPDGTNGFYTSLPEIFFLCDDNEAITYFYWDDQVPIEYDPLMEEIMSRAGAHNLSFYSVDIANNKEETQHIDIIVDLKPPITKLTREPIFPDGDNDWYNNITLELESYSEDVFKTYYYFDNDQKEREYWGPMGDDIEDGERTLYYYSVDLAGNRETPSSFNFKLDTTPPNAFFKPLSGEVETGSEMLFSATESSDNIGVGTYKYIYGDGTFSNWVTRDNVTHSYSKEGTFTAGLRVRDASGLESDIYQRRITITGKEGDNDESGMMSFLPSSPIYQSGFIIMVAALLLVTLLVVIFAVKRSKRKNFQIEPDSEDDPMSKEAIRLYGERVVRKRESPVRRPRRMGPERRSDSLDADFEEESYLLYDDTSSHESLFLSHGEVEEEFLLPENTSEEWESFNEYQEEDSIVYEVEDEYYSDTETDYRDFSHETETFSEMPVQDMFSSESSGDISYPEDSFKDMAHEEEDWFSKNDEHDIVDLVPVRTDDTGKVMYASEDSIQYDGEEEEGEEDEYVDADVEEDVDEDVDEDVEIDAGADVGLDEESKNFYLPEKFTGTDGDKDSEQEDLQGQGDSLSKKEVLDSWNL
ncbi:MAG: PKD domain-containing protein [Candidatus Thermoplasmatota archaeon]|nr:PKD domain-containing protein [Candidatus Thermoplasmatota archaeon]